MREFSNHVYIHRWFHDWADRTGKDIEGYIKNHPDKFRLVSEIPGVKIYEYIGENQTDDVYLFELGDPTKLHQHEKNKNLVEEKERALKGRYRY